MRNPQILDRGPDLLRDRERIFRITAGKDDGNFLSTISSGEVARAKDTAFDRGSYCAQAIIPDLVAILIIESLEVIYVKEDEPHL